MACEHGKIHAFSGPSFGFCLLCYPRNIQIPHNSLYQHVRSYIIYVHRDMSEYCNANTAALVSVTSSVGGLVLAGQGLFRLIILLAVWRVPWRQSVKDDPTRGSGQ